MDRSSPAPSSPAARVPSELGLVLLLGAIAAFGPLAIDMYLPAFGAIAGDLGTSNRAVGWLLLAGIIAGHFA